MPTPSILQKTLRHEPMELALDDSVSLRTLGIMLVRAWLAWVFVFIVFAIFGGLVAAHGGSPALLYVGSVLSACVSFYGSAARLLRSPNPSASGVRCSRIAQGSRALVSS